MKPPHQRTNQTTFDFHQDGEYLGAARTPFISCWFNLDECTEENGTLLMIPYPKPKKNTIETEKEEFTDFVSWHHSKASAYPPKSTLRKWLASADYDESPLARLEVPLYLPAGSLVILSSEVMHRSMDNRGDSLRRAWMPQFSATPIFKANSTSFLAHAVPLTK